MLGVSVVAADGFRVHPAVQFVSVAHEKATGVGAALGCAQAGGHALTSRVCEEPVCSARVTEVLNDLGRALWIVWIRDDLARDG